ncbi:MAG: hypothetical protein M3Z32_03310, partial [Acidobacteriota bacterium]|nr:hypothetical protein [Acidobacteriota bacterium]
MEGRTRRSTLWTTVRGHADVNRGKVARLQRWLSGLGCGDLSGCSGQLLGVGAGSGFQRGGQRDEPFPSGGDGVQGAHLADGVAGQGQPLGFPGTDVHFGEEQL